MTHQIENLYEISAFSGFFHRTRTENLDSIRESGLVPKRVQGFGGLGDGPTLNRVYISVGKSVESNYSGNTEPTTIIRVTLKESDEEMLGCDEEYSFVAWDNKDGDEIPECEFEKLIEHIREGPIELFKTILTPESFKILTNWLNTEPSLTEIEKFLSGMPEWCKCIFIGSTLTFLGVIPPEKLTIIKS